MKNSFENPGAVNLDHVREKKRLRDCFLDEVCPNSGRPAELYANGSAFCGFASESDYETYKEKHPDVDVERIFKKARGSVDHQIYIESVAHSFGVAIDWIRKKMDVDKMSPNEIRDEQIDRYADIFGQDAASVVKMIQNKELTVGDLMHAVDEKKRAS